MHVVCLNGQLIPNKNISASDGCFETMFHTCDCIPLLQRHTARLTSSLAELNIKVPSFFKDDFIADAIEKLCVANNLTTARIRLSVFKTSSSGFNYLLESFSITGDLRELNVDGCTLTIYKDECLIPTQSSNIKKTEREIYNNAGAYASTKNYTDAIILNDDKNIVETSIANIFLVKNNVLYTPALSQGCIAGIMRQMVLQIAKLQKIVCSEVVISVEDLYTADEIFITNAVRGIRWVASINDNTFTENKMAIKLYNSIQQNINYNGKANT